MKVRIGSIVSYTNLAYDLENEHYKITEIEINLDGEDISTDIKFIDKKTGKEYEGGDYFQLSDVINDHESDEQEEEHKLCPYCGLPMYEHEDDCCPAGTEEFGGRR